MCASAVTGELTTQRVYECLGIAGIQQCGELMRNIANHDAASALQLFNRFYAEGKDLGALVDELACLTRDFIMLKTAPKEAITLLSGVADEVEVKEISKSFSMGELTRMMELIQQTAAGFTRNTSRRMDVELLLVNLCNPSLSLDPQSLNARLTRLEEQIHGGFIQLSTEPVVEAKESQLSKDTVEPKKEPEIIATKAVPAGFWTDVVAELRSELPVSVGGFFNTTENAPIIGTMDGEQFVLRCSNDFTAKMVNKPEILQVIERKVSGKLGRKVSVRVSDGSAPQKNTQMEQLLKFGREHSDVIKIKE